MFISLNQTKKLLDSHPVKLDGHPIEFELVGSDYYIKEVPLELDDSFFLYKNLIIWDWWSYFPDGKIHIIKLCT